jgi:hypothetical protein
MIPDSIVVTHPFHPLCGQRLEIEGEQRPNGVLQYRCAGPFGTVVVPVAWTDRYPHEGETRLSYERLADLARLVTAIRRS